MFYAKMLRLKFKINLIRIQFFKRGLDILKITTNFYADFSLCDKIQIKKSLFLNTLRDHLLPLRVKKVCGKRQPGYGLRLFGGGWP